MMRVLLWILLVLVIGVAVLIAVRFDQGYVLVVFPPWRVEMSFILMLALTFGMFVLSYLVIRLLRVTLRLPSDVRAWQEKRRRIKAEDELSRAVAAMMAGEYGHARSLADKAIQRESTPLASLVAARCAAELGERLSVQDLLACIGDDVGELVAARQAVQRRLDELNPPLGNAAGALPPPP